MANGIGSFVRALGALGPVAAGGLRGFTQGTLAQQQQQLEEQERQREAQRMALERSLTEARIQDLLSQAEARRQPQAPEPVRGEIVQGPAGFLRIDPTTGQAAPVTLPGGQQARPAPEPQAAPDPVSLQRFSVPGQGVFTFNPQTGAVEPVMVGGEQLREAAGAADQPASIRQAVADNRRQVSVIESALKGLEERPESVGPQFALPGAELAGQFLDPEGVRVRADIADVGSLEIRDRSGAAVTISESPRLSPFIPSPRDTPEAAEVKLRRLLALIEDETQRLEGAALTAAPTEAAPTEQRVPVGPTAEFGEARSLVEGMAPDAARAALEQAGFSAAEIARILGG